MATEYINDIVVWYHDNYVNDGEKYGTFTIFENEFKGCEMTLTQDEAVKLARFLKKYVEVKL